MFRGREQSRPGRVFRLGLSVDVAELGLVESAPTQDGRNMIMVWPAPAGTTPAAALSG